MTRIYCDRCGVEIMDGKCATLQLTYRACFSTNREREKEFCETCAELIDYNFEHDAFKNVDLRAGETPLNHR